MHQLIRQFNIRRVLFSIIIIVLFISNVYCIYRMQQYKEEQERISYQAEAMYQCTFGELADSVETMHGQLAKLLVTASPEQMLYGLSGLWREVYSAISSLSALPIAMHQLEETDLLLHDMAEYSYYLMRKHVLEQQPLTSQDWNQLEDFYQRAGIVQQELARLENAMLTEDFRLANLSINDEKNIVATTFHSIESQITALPEITFEEGIRKIEAKPKPIQGSYINETEAIAKADAFLSALEKIQPVLSSHKNNAQGSLAFISDNTTLPIYCIAYPNHRYIEVSCAKGLVLQYYYTRELQSPVLSLSQAEAQAQNILRQLQIYDMVCVESSSEETTASFTFVPLQEHTYLYPDMIHMQLALDDGTLLSFDQTSYQTRHYYRELPIPQITSDAILKNCNPDLTVSDIRLALIMDEYSNKELLTYELRGSILNESFAVFINANTGQEVRIVRLSS